MSRRAVAHFSNRACKLLFYLSIRWLLPRECSPGGEPPTCWTGQGAPPVRELRKYRRRWARSDATAGLERGFRTDTVEGLSIEPRRQEIGGDCSQRPG